MPADASDLQVARVVDALCDKFECALGANQLPVIETFLEELPPEVRAALLVELLGLELDYRLARGQQPDIAEYAARFPEFSTALLEGLFDLAARTAKAPPTPIGAGVDSKLQTMLSPATVAAAGEETSTGELRRVLGKNGLSRPGSAGILGSPVLP